MKQPNGYNTKYSKEKNSYRRTPLLRSACFFLPSPDTNDIPHKPVYSLFVCKMMLI